MWRKHSNICGAGNNVRLVFPTSSHVQVGHAFGRWIRVLLLSVKAYSEQTT